MTGQQWVFPIGHYLGPFFPAPDEPLESHRVRVGADVVMLATDAEFVVWGLAHGLPGPAADRPDGTWARADLVEVARERGTTGVDAAVDALLATGALVEVGADDVDPATFARRYRLMPLLFGLGTGPGRPDRYQIGAFGTEPSTAVDLRVFDLWQWAARVGSLSDLAGMQSATAPFVGGTPDGVPGLLHRVHTLVANGYAYLDVAATSR